MALTYQGSFATYIATGNNATAQNLLVFENGAASRVNVFIRRLVMQKDQTAALATVMPIAKTYRMTTAYSGGDLVPKGTFDTAYTSDDNVKIVAPLSNAISVSLPTDIAWEQFSLRMHSVIQKVVGIDNSLLPVLIATNDFKLTPGQMLLVRINALTAYASNTDIANNWWIQGVWEEYAIGTFNISGTITLSGAPVTGAKVMVLEADDALMTNAHLVEVKTTGVDGTWASTICSGRVGAAFVQYVNGGTYYTAPGSPFLEE